MLSNGTSALNTIQDIAISPVFKCGDSVRLRSKFYEDWEHDTVLEISPDGNRYRLRYDGVAAGVFNWDASQLELAYPAKETTAPFLTIVQRPETIVCPSALREPKCTFEQAGRVFEALRYDNDLRIFQDIETGATYHLKVTVVQVESQVFIASFINGRIVDTQDWLVNRQFAGRSMRYIYNAEQAVAGAYDHLQSLVLSGKA